MSVAEANRQFFNAISDAYYNKPWYQAVNQKLTDYLRSHLDWVGISFASTESSTDREVRLLDYACGPGVMASIFGPYVTITRGIDISPNMVASFNARAQDANLSPSKISAVVGDLLSKDTPEPVEFAGPEYRDFDLATAGFAFHHFEDVVLAAQRLKARLRPGGVLLVSDFLEGGDLKADENENPIEETEGDHTGHIRHGKHTDFNDADHHHNHHHGHQHGKADTAADDDPTKNVRKEMAQSIVVPHFTLQGVRDFFLKAGFVDVEAIALKERVYMEFAGRKVWRTILFAKGRRPAEGGSMEKSEL